MSTLTLTEAKQHLNITVTTYDAELQTFIDSAEAAIAKRCGPLAATSTTVRVRGGCSLSLPVTPTISLTSVTPVLGSALTLADLHLEPSGEVTYNTGAVFPAPWYDVVYSAGRSSVPADLLAAVKELLRHLWTTQRGGSARPGGPVSDALSNTIPGSAYTFPIRVEQLIAPHAQVGC